MATRKPTPAPAPQSDAEQTPDATPEPVALVDMDWDTLPEPVAMPVKVVTVNIRPKVIESVPEPIRKRAEASLGINAELEAKKPATDGKRKRVNYHWDVQRVATEAMGHKFVTLLTKYGKYRPADVEVPFAAEHSPKGQVTARCGKPMHYVTNEDGTYSEANPSAPGAYLGVRYSVRPFEARSQAATLPGTA